MDSLRWQKISQIFDEVTSAPVAERPALLERMCATDATIRVEVEKLLQADEKQSVFEHELDVARSELASTWSREQEAAKLGEQIGPWRILREIGAGGMGVVLLAERADGQFEQRVAIKLMRRDADADSVLKRFLRERQILANLEHPNIAHLIDGGITPDGRPYFAMEYVDGRPLLRYCEEERVGFEGRLRLFLQMCAAVQYAHQRLLVHRDLKPSNVLVTAEGQIKLLDFGIAKSVSPAALDVDATSDTQRLMTPSYAAPEQLSGEAITTATDVYALGCVLYELVCGQRPYDLSGVHSVAEILARIGQTRPTLPSSMARTHAKPWSRRLRGDFDTIAMAALRYSPDSRYPTVTALARDIESFLNRMPIAARPDSMGYRLRKFVVRHRAVVAVTAVTVLGLAGAFATALWEAAEARKQASAANAVKDFMLDIFTAADPESHPGTDISARELLDIGAQSLSKRLDRQPQIQADVLRALADSYAALGLNDKAEAIARRLVVATESAGSTSPDALQAHALLAEILQSEHKLQDASHEAASSLSRDVEDNPTPELVRAHLILANDARFRADIATEKIEAQAAIANADKLGINHGLLRARAHYALALAMLESADFSEARVALNDVVGQLAHAGPLSPAEARRAQVMLAVVNAYLDKEDEALRILTALADSEAHTFGADHPLVADAKLKAAAVLYRLDRLPEAQDTANAGVDIVRKAKGLSPSDLAVHLQSLGEIATTRGDLKTGRAALAEATALFPASGGGQHGAPPFALRFVHTRVLALGGDAQAGAEFRRLMLENSEKSETMWEEGINLGWVLLYESKFNESIQWFRRAQAMAPKTDTPRVQKGNKELAIGIGAALVESGQCDEAIRQLDAVLNATPTKTPNRQHAQALLWRGVAKLRLQQRADAEQDLSAALNEHLQVFGNDSVWTAQARLAHAAAIAKLRPRDAAKERADAQAIVVSMMGSEHLLRTPEWNDFK